MFKLCGDTDDVDDDDLSTPEKEYNPRVTPSDEQARKAELAALFEGAAGGEFAPTFEGGGVYFASSAEDPGAARAHWTNYNIAASLRPNYMDVDEYWAAELLLKRVRIFLAKRRAAKALVAGDLAIICVEIKSSTRLQCERFDRFDTMSSAVLRELDESNRFAQKSAESTLI